MAMPVEAGGLIVFPSASLLLNPIPGNDMMFVIGQPLRGSVRSGIAASLGVATGPLVHLGLVALGAAVLLTRHPMLFDAIRYLGAA